MSINYYSHLKYNVGISTVNVCNKIPHLVYKLTCLGVFTTNFSLALYLIDSVLNERAVDILHQNALLLLYRINFTSA